MKQTFSGLIHMAVDVGLYYLALLCAFEFRHLISGRVLGINFQPAESVVFSEFALMFWIPAVLVLFYLYEGLYASKRPYWLDLKEMLKVCTLAIVALFGFMGFIKMPVTFSRFVIVFTVILWLIFTALSHNLVAKVFHRFGIFSKRVVVVGDTPFFKIARKSLHQNSYLNYVINFWVSTISPKKIPEDVSHWHFNHDINWNELAKKCPNLIVSEAFSKHERMLMQKLLLLFREVFIIPDDAGTSYLNSELLFLFSAKVFLTKVHNNLRSGWAKLTKWLFDRVLGLIIFAVAMPIIGVISILIMIDSKGPAFLERDNPARIRIGWKARDFKVAKFRSMFVNADRDILPRFLKENPKEAENWKKYKKILGRDPRVTRIGRILRATSLDELPQIINVVKGEMSLIGPRPYLPRERDDMKEYIDTIVSVKPGMTGLWQISGRNDLTFEDRMRLDVWYVHNWSLWLDMVILIKTFFVVISRRGAK